MGAEGVEVSSPRVVAASREGGAWLLSPAPPPLPPCCAEPGQGDVRMADAEIGRLDGTDAWSEGCMGEAWGGRAGLAVPLAGVPPVPISRERRAGGT